MDIGSKVTVSYQLKRGNYAVNGDSCTDITDYSGVTCDCFFTSFINGTTPSVDDQREASGGCDCDHNDRQARGSVCEEYRIQGESIQNGSTKQIVRSSWRMATSLGKTRLVYTQTSIRSEQVCAPQIRHMVQGVQVSPRKELVLTSESV